MAQPLFVADEATLKTKLRLSAVPATALDTEAIFDEAILRARLRLYAFLGIARVNVLLATPFTEQPTTDPELMRARANVVEVKIVKCLLMEMLPHTFMDASGDVDHRWNEEAPTRENSQGELEAALLRCENDILADLIVLKDDDADGGCDMQVYDGTPDCPAPAIGLSLKSRSRRWPHDPSCSGLC